MSWEDGIKNVAIHFWDAAMQHAWELEFGSPKNAKSFDQCWKKFLEQSGGKKP